MHVLTTNLYSETMQRPTPLNVLVPDPARVGPGPYPVLLLLHGMHDDYNSWLHKSNLRVHAEDYPLIVVLPDGGNFFYLDLHQTVRYETMLTEDLWQFVNSTFPVRQSSKWAIGGLSMGGYGALRLGLRYPEKFASIYAHSSTIPWPEMMKGWLDRLSLSSMVTPEEASVHSLLDRYTPETMPRLGFDCGVDDSLLEENQRFRDRLVALKLPHTYREHPGEHNWPYWDLHVREALVQHAEVLGIRRAGTPPPPADPATE